MSKEAFARANNALDLGSEENVIHDVERVAAMGGGDTLGGLLLRFSESAQPQWGKRITLILARRLRAEFHFERWMSERIAATAMLEFHHPHCSKCHGAKEIIGEKLRVVCDACNGLGKEHYSDKSRRQHIGSYNPRIERAVGEAHRQMSEALGAFLSRAERRLRDEA